MRDPARRAFCQGLGALALSFGCHVDGRTRGAVGSRDLLVRGGRVFTEQGLRRVDVRVRGGIIVEIARDLGARGEPVLDANDMLVLPGGIDPHVHFSRAVDVPAEAEDFIDNYRVGSAAALAGGITTVGAMVFPEDDSDVLRELELHERSVAVQSRTDVMFHPVLITSSSASRSALAEFVRQGHTSVKLFMLMVQWEKQLPGFVEIIREAGRRGMMTLIHCEHHALTKGATAELVRSGRTSLRYYADSSPVESELQAVRDAIGLSNSTGAPIYVVHLSSGAALDACTRARGEGTAVYVETRPMYLNHTRAIYDQPEGPLYTGQPPLRTSADLKALWRGLRERTIHTIGSDHSPVRESVKLDPKRSVANYRAGTPSVQTMLPLLFSEGVRRGNLTLDRFVELSSSNAARLFGLYPRKGVIRRGSDADLAIWDPALRLTIKPEMLLSRAGYALDENREVQGWPVYVIRRGELACDHGEVKAAPGSGLLLARRATQPLG